MRKEKTGNGRETKTRDSNGYHKVTVNQLPLFERSFECGDSPHNLRKATGHDLEKARPNLDGTHCQKLIAVFTAYDVERIRLFTLRGCFKRGMNEFFMVAV
jgi:hypothetical protein